MRASQSDEVPTLTTACYPFQTSWGGRTKRRRGSFFSRALFQGRFIRGGYRNEDRRDRPRDDEFALMDEA